MPEARPNGFTVLELLAILSIIAFLALAVGSHLANVTKEAQLTTALEEMDNLKDAIGSRFYPDLGCIPYDPGPDLEPHTGDDRPWLSTRYLCLADDRSDTTQPPDSAENPQSHAMWVFLRSQINPADPKDESAKATATGKLTWDRYRQKGWRGPYMEHDTLARISDDESHAMPLVATPWFDHCEALALDAEKSRDKTAANALRKGKFYLITADTIEATDGSISFDRRSARIVSFGPNCADDGAYLNNADTAGIAEPVQAVTLRKTNTDEPENQDAYYTGDDIVVFIFGGGATRKPAQ